MSAADRYCFVNDCRFPATHVKRDHRCGTCGQYGHGQVECGNKDRLAFLAGLEDTDMPKEFWCMSAGCRSHKGHTTTAHHCSTCSGFHAWQDCPKNKTKPGAGDKVIEVTCPICRAVNKVPENATVIKGSEEDCKVCMDKKVGIYLPHCGHVCLCVDCFKQMGGVKAPEAKDAKDAKDAPERAADEREAQDIARRKFRANNTKIYCQVPAVAGPLIPEGAYWLVKRDQIRCPFTTICVQSARNKLEADAFIVGYTKIE